MTTPTPEERKQRTADIGKLLNGEDIYGLNPPTREEYRDAADFLFHELARREQEHQGLRTATSTLCAFIWKHADESVGELRKAHLMLLTPREVQELNNLIADVEESLQGGATTTTPAEEIRKAKLPVQEVEWAQTSEDEEVVREFAERVPLPSTPTDRPA